MSRESSNPQPNNPASRPVRGNATPPPPAASTLPGRKEHILESEKHDTRLRCPKDGTFMQKEQIGGPHGVAIDRCGHCGALWLDKGELEKIIAMKAAKHADIGPFTNDRYIKPLGALTCPRDGSIMTEIADSKQKHVLIMLCSDCGGKLLDSGELIDLQEFTFVERLKATLKIG